MKICEIGNNNFWNKNTFYKNEGGKSVFKMFSKELKFYKNNFEIRFCL